MHISGEGKIGIALGLLALGGGGAVMVGPEQLWIGWTMIGLAASGALALAVHHNHPDLSERRGFVLVLIGISLIISGSTLGLVGAFQMDARNKNHGAEQKHPPIDLTKNEGVLEPGNLPTPRIAADISIPNDALAIYTGGGVHWTHGSSLTVFRMAGEDMLRVERREASLVVTVLRIYNGSGNIIARLDEDGFWVAPQVRKKRPDKSSLIVFDERDVEVLNLKFLNLKAISVTALLRNPKRPGTTMSVTDKQVQHLPSRNMFSGASSENAAVAFDF